MTVADMPCVFPTEIILAIGRECDVDTKRVLAETYGLDPCLFIGKVRRPALLEEHLEDRKRFCEIGQIFNNFQVYLQFYVRGEFRAPSMCVITWISNRNIGRDVTQVTDRGHEHVHQIMRRNELGWKRRLMHETKLYPILYSQTNQTKQELSKSLWPRSHPLS